MNLEPRAPILLSLFLSEGLWCFLLPITVCDCLHSTYLKQNVALTCVLHQIQPTEAIFALFEDLQTHLKVGLSASPSTDLLCSILLLP